MSLLLGDGHRRGGGAAMCYVAARADAAASARVPCSTASEHPLEISRCCTTAISALNRIQEAHGPLPNLAIADRTFQTATPATRSCIAPRANATRNAP